MRIAVLCPGAWSKGLNSPERGEGRWSQNYVTLLTQAGHQVVAISAGSEFVHQTGNPTLIHESVAQKYGPYDIYIDSSWWEGESSFSYCKKVHPHSLVA